MQKNCASHRLAENAYALIESILALEWEMFQAVPTACRYSCQEDPENFRLHRRAQFAAWSVPTLESYLLDLRLARTAGRNLMAIKYARMDDRLPRENFSSRIRAIVDLVAQGQKQFIAKFPGLMKGGRPLDDSGGDSDRVSFTTYLKGELETYSETTLGLLLADIQGLQKMKSSLSEVIYSYLAKQWGYDSLDDLEKGLQK